MHQLRGISATGTAIGEILPPGGRGSGGIDSDPIGVLIEHGAVRRLPRPDITADLPATVRPPSPGPGAGAIDPDAAVPTGITEDGTIVVGLSAATIGGYSIAAVIWHCASRSANHTEG